MELVRALSCAKGVVPVNISLCPDPGLARFRFAMLLGLLETDPS